ncbi:MAG TPA: hypothetical protein DHW82_04565 [Spirochaetia bacterium]|nr:MAG: hypothetical protein A2Y41_06190 [Spirochaetes bacterium GWB1_36_13]HCL56267.1 hypothetical protein [Spirochaetia bacterium]
MIGKKLNKFFFIILLFFWLTGSYSYSQPKSWKLFKYLDTTSYNFEALVLSPDGKHLFAGNRGGEIKVWKIDQFRLIKTFQALNNPPADF